MNDQICLDLKDVSKYYRRGSETVHAIERVSLSIRQGEFVAVLGPSGSGKTTLMNLMGCLDRPSSGALFLNGTAVHDRSERELVTLRRDAVGFVFQQFFLIPTLTVLQNTALPALFAGRDAEERARELLTRVGLGHRLDHRPGQLSGGEMQRTAVARSLINNPSVLLADEPTGNLDSKNARNILDLLRELNASGVTVVIVTHNRDLSRDFSRTVHIEDGRLCA